MSESLRVPRLMLVTDRRRSAHPLTDLVDAAVRGGVDAVQLRENDLPAADLIRLASQINEIVADRASLLINSNLTAAARLGLGVHLPEAGPSTADARRHVGPGVLLGRSVHSPAAAAAAVGADYLVAGNVFATPSKPGHPPLGPEKLRQIVGMTWSPVLAIGGITAARVSEVMVAGAHGVAVVGAIAGAPDPAAAAAALRVAVDEAVPEDEMQDNTQGVGPVRVLVNGKDVEVEPDTTVADYLAEKGFHDRLVVVELNGTILSRRTFDSTVLAQGDTVEVVHFVGGG